MDTVQPESSQSAYAGLAESAGPASFGALLRRYRLSAGLSQEALAERAGLSVHALSALENGRRQTPYRHTVTLLAEALRLSAAETARLEMAVVRVRAGTRAGNGNEDTPPSPIPTNLPVALSSFIGREREQAEVRALLGAARLVTLTGAGGAGKTRLALAVAEAMRSDYPDGVWLVELAPLADAALAPRAVAQTLGLREAAGQTLLDTLHSYLAARRLLLVLDNCEHLIAACADLATALLQRCAELHLLTTSREGLWVDGEQLYRVPSLPAPPLSSQPAPEALGSYAAVALFVARARERRANFSLNPQNARAIAEICARLDGLPLALELAAARVEALPVEGIAARLDERFRLLTGGPRTALPRQQTLRATLDWSYGLLSAAEQALLRRLAVFTGGWTLEAAEAICCGEAIEGWAVLDLLASLVNKSLALLEEGAFAGEQERYRLLETVRQYGSERLSANGDEATRVRDRHLDYFLALAEQAEPRLNGPEQGDWLARLEWDHDNLRAALAWAWASGDGERGLRLAVALRGFWDAHGYLREGRDWLERLLAFTGNGDETTMAYARAKALNGAGWLALQQGEYDQAVTLCDEGLALERALGDRAGMALSLLNLGVVALDRGDYERAIALNEESLALGRELEDSWGIAASLANLGTVAMEQGNYERAAPLLEESMALLQERGDSGGVALVLHNLAFMERARGFHDHAAPLYARSLALFHTLDERQGIARCLDGLASVACARHEPRRAARLAGAAESLRESLGISLPPVDRAVTERDMATARAVLGDNAFAAAWADGAALPLEEAIVEALGVTL